MCRDDDNMSGPAQNEACGTDADSSWRCGYAVIGNAGQALSEFSNKTQAPDWSVWRKAEFGYSTIEVNGAKSLTMKFWADSDHSLMNEFTLEGKLRPSEANTTFETILSQQE